MTLLIGSLFVDDLAELPQRAASAFAAGADALELRIDGFEGDPATLAGFLKSQPARKFIVTCRSAEQGGSFRGDTMQRVALLIAVARDTGAWVDFEWADWQRSANIRQKVLLACAADGTEAPRLILSHHDFSGVPADPRKLIPEMRKEGAIAKLAYRARNADDGFLALDLMREFGAGVIAVAMGEEGLFTRVLARKFGAWATYAALTAETPTAPGQCTMEQMVSQFRFPEIGAQTQVYGVIGDPIAQSLSPLLHNAWFSRYGIDAVYLPFLVHAEPEDLARFLDGCFARTWLNIAGFSITAPHKEAALRWAGTRADRLSQSLGAANTLVWSADGIRMHNTDAHAAVDALAAALNMESTALRPFSVDILGAGGTGRALAITLAGLGCKVTIFDRKLERAEQIAHAAGGAARVFSEAPSGKGDILINATALGAEASKDGAAPELVAQRRLVFDVNYRPARTAYVRAAEAAGIPAMNGTDMFIRQAATQFALWTGVEPDMELGRKLVQEALAADEESTS